MTSSARVEKSTLYDKTSKGDIKVWTIEVHESVVNQGVITTTFGKYGGKMQTKVKVITVGKNIGKANETTPFQQACLEAKSTWTKKRDKGYEKSLADLEKRGDLLQLLPALAHSFLKRGHDIIFPASEQPKFNGVRCLVHCTKAGIKYISRKGKMFTTLEHLTPLFKKMMIPGEVFDGEIYTHGWTFQEIIRAVKKQRPESLKLEFHAYDLISDDHFIKRFGDLAFKIAMHPNPQIIICPTLIIDNADQVKEAHDRHVQNGYEGVIIRNMRVGGYICKHRSKHLQKYKEFIDEEFPIIGGHADADGCVVFEVSNYHAKTKEAETFNVRPKGTVNARTRWLADIKNIIGKPLTVRYQELSEDGVPIFPVGQAIRDYE